MLDKLTILVVDDEPETLKYVGANLKARGYQVQTASNGLDAVRACEENRPDLMVLDIGLPGLDGFEVCAVVRRRCALPILILSAHGREQDIIQALDLGADDYLTKPFDVGVLLARVKAILRRTATTTAKIGPCFNYQGLVINFENRQVVVGNQEVKLTRTEYELLAYLAQHAGRVLTHRALLQAIWGPEYGNEADYLWAYMRRLRRKVEPNPTTPQYILTEHGVGYRFCAPD
jgi:DNA-binding response OmpR family regulator